MCHKKSPFIGSFIINSFNEHLLPVPHRIPKRMKGELYRAVAPGVLKADVAGSHEKLILMIYDDRCLSSTCKSSREDD